MLELFIGKAIPWSRSQSSPRKQSQSHERSRLRSDSRSRSSYRPRTDSVVTPVRKKIAQTNDMREVEDPGAYFVVHYIGKTGSCTEVILWRKVDSKAFLK